MRLDDFLEFFESPHGNNKNWRTDGGKLVSTYNNTGVPWEFRWKLAEEVIGIDFQCDFQEGVCVRERSEPETRTEVNHCCNQCYLTIGNLLYLPTAPWVLKEIANLFNPDRIGFWRPEVGCILPHKYRSTICLVGRCAFLRRTTRMNKEDLAKLHKLSNIVATWKREQGANK